MKRLICIQVLSALFSHACMNAKKEAFNPKMYYAQYDKKINNELSSLNRNLEFFNSKFPNIYTYN